MSNLKALAVFEEAKLSRYQYNVVRQSAPDKFLSYQIIQEEKKVFFRITVHYNKRNFR